MSGEGKRPESGLSGGGRSDPGQSGGRGGGADGGAGGAGLAAGTEARGGSASWLAGLLSSGAPKGRLKGNSLKLLAWAGIVVLLGMALMGVGDILWPSANPGAGTVAVGSGALPDSGPLGGADGGAGGGTNAGGSGSSGAGGQGYWVSVEDLENMMARTLERILSRIEGAGEVTVAVSLETGATYVFGYDETQTSQTTQEHDANGGSRVVTETNTTKTAVVVSQGASSQPVVVRVDLPPVKGVVVVAPGASDSRIKALLSEAVRTLYGVPAHRVVVLAGE